LQLGCNVLICDSGVKEALRYDVDHTKAALLHIRELGFDATEYSHTLHFTREQATQLRAFTAEIGLRPWSVHASGSAGFLTPGQRAQTLKDKRHCIDLTEALGAQVLVYHVDAWVGLDRGEIDPDDYLPGETSVLEELCEYAKPKGVEIALENGHTMGMVKYIKQLVDTVAAPNLGFCIDTGHAILGDTSAPEVIRIMGEKLFTTHLADNLGKSDDHYPPMRGIVNWEEVAQALAEVGYNRVLELELTDMPLTRPDDYDQELEMCQGYEAARKLDEMIQRYRQ